MDNKLTKRLAEIAERLEKATPYEETPDSVCPECKLKTYGYRHWAGCELLDKHRAVLDHAPADLALLLRIVSIQAKALEEIISLEKRVAKNGMMNAAVYNAAVFALRDLGEWEDGE